jgi:uracil-DNA glycosylase family 4
MLVGEALGAQEEIYGRPFVGDAGRKLNYVLHRARVNRKSLVITNTVRCRPPKNRKPSKKEMDACWPYLLHDILKYKPTVIVALGATASHVLMSAGETKAGKLLLAKQAGSWRGYPQEKTFTYTGKKKTFTHNCQVISTHHPSAALRNWALDDLLVFDFVTAKKLAGGECRFKDPDTKVNAVKTLTEVQALFKRLSRVNRFVVDLETTGLDPHKSEIMCIGFCCQAGEAHVLPLRVKGNKTYWSPTEQRYIKKHITTIFERSEIIGQNIKFDIKHLRKWLGIVDYNIAFDTMIAHSLIDENKPHNLTFLCQWFLNWEKYDAVMDDYKSSEGRKDVFKTWEVPDQSLWQYCGMDVDATYRLTKIFTKELNAQKLVKAFKNEMGLILPLADMEYRGIQIDTKKTNELIKKYTKEVVKIQKRLTKTASRYLKPAILEGEDADEIEFNANSPKQVAVLLKACGADLRRLTPTGQPSTNSIVIDKLALKKSAPGRIATQLKTLRLYANKYLGTYLHGRDGTKGFLQFLGSHDRVHPNYNIGLARTGRLSADDPAIQTLPRDGGMREMVIPDNPKNQKLIAVDYSKIELCVLAYLANDKVMCHELKSGVDLHTRMAVTVRLNRNPTDKEFEKIAPDISKNERTLAKCFHPDTEVLTKIGWKRILDLNEGEEIIQAMPLADGKVNLEWCVPTEVFTQPSKGKLIHLKNEGVDLRVTEDHRMLGWGESNWCVRTPHEFNYFRKWANAGSLIQRRPTKYDINFLRLCVAVQADGSYKCKQIIFGFTKKRKIHRMRELLRLVGSVGSKDYVESIQGKKRWVITYTLKGNLSYRIRRVLGETKSFPWSWLQLPPMHREAILDEARHWDSRRAENWTQYTYVNIDLQSANVLQAIAAVTGRKTRMHITVKDNPKHNDVYEVSIKDHSTSRGDHVETTYVSYNGKVACLSVPSSFVLVRDGGVPVICGQSVNFGVIYGVGAKSIADAKADAFPSNMPIVQRIEKVKQIIKTYFKKYEGVARYREMLIATWEAEGVLRAQLFKRKRRLTGIDWFNSKWGEEAEHVNVDYAHTKNEALNFEVQSTASAILTQATRQCYEGMKTAGIPEFRMLLSLHDALIFSCHKGYIDQAIEKIKQWMEITLPKKPNYKYSMPLKVDALVQDYWGQGEYD